MFLIHSLFILTFFVVEAHAQATPQERWEGYRAADSAEVRNAGLSSQTMDFIQNSVFEMQTMNLDTSGRYEEVVVNEQPHVTDLQTLSTNPTAFQIETCRKQNLQICPIFPISERGTIFFNRRKFTTCRHGFHNWLTIAAQLNGNISVARLSPPVMLRNHIGEIIYNSAYPNRPLMRFSAINENPGLNYVTDYERSPSPQHVELAKQSDYVEMTLSESIAREFARTERTAGYSNLSENEETYLVGYPLATNYFTNQADEALGHTLVVSNGYALSALPQNGVLQTTNYSSGGMSGGAIVTSSGEIAGVNCRVSNPQNPSATISRHIPIGAIMQRQHWRNLPYPSEQELASLQQSQTTSTNVSQ